MSYSCVDHSILLLATIPPSQTMNQITALYVDFFSFCLQDDRQTWAITQHFVIIPRKANISLTKPAILQLGGWKLDIFQNYTIIWSHNHYDHSFQPFQEKDPDRATVKK